MSSALSLNCVVPRCLDSSLLWTSANDFKAIGSGEILPQLKFASKITQSPIRHPIQRTREKLLHVPLHSRQVPILKVRTNTRILGLAVCFLHRLNFFWPDLRLTNPGEAVHKGWRRHGF